MKGLHIFYSENQQVDSNSSFSPSAGKPAKVLKDWKKNKVPMIIHEPRPLNRAELCLAHDPTYIQGILDLKVSNGFGNKNPEVAKSLHWTTGSFASAARFAVENNCVTFSPTSGFHHAEYHGGGGFCTVNGLVIAAQLLKLHGLASRVGIIDLDEHAGNGQKDIKNKLGLDWLELYSVGYDHRNGEAVLADLPNIFETQFKDVDVVFVQFGADSCTHDPLGGTWTPEQMRRRDRIVFELTKKYNKPVVFNLAGGYQERFQNVLALHRMTVEEYFRVYHDLDLNTGCEEEYEAPQPTRYDIHEEALHWGTSDWEDTSWEDDIVEALLNGEDWIDEIEK
jgi:acetoin utilization deacetylase AcuC-like enzyme